MTFLFDPRPRQAARRLARLMALTMLALVGLGMPEWAAARPAAVGPSAGATACVGTTVTPATNLQALVNSSPEGATFCLKSGLYRGLSIRPKTGQSFIGEPGVVLNGSKEVTSFVVDGNRWKNTQQTQEAGYVWNGPCAAGRSACKYPEDLFFDNVMQTRVMSLTQVVAGSWYFDYAADTIYVGSNPAGRRVEISLTRFAFGATQAAPRPNVTIANMVIEKYAVPGHMHAVGEQYLSPGWIVRDCEVRLNHGGGIGINGGQALRNHVHHNGQSGISGIGVNTLVEGNEIDHNNTAGYEPRFEAGGGKFSRTTNLIYRGNHVHHNYGQGAWTDIANQGVLYENNLVENNDGVGIMHEISYDAIIRNNTVSNNGVRGEYVYGAGILISSSRNVEVYGNRVTVGATSGSTALPTSRMGIIVFQGERGEDICSVESCAATNNNVHDNTIWYTSRLNNLGGGIGISGSGIMKNGNDKLLAGNVFNANRYIMPDCNEKRWHWVDVAAWTSYSGNLTAFKAQGYEANGTCEILSQLTLPAVSGQ